MSERKPIFQRTQLQALLFFTFTLAIYFLVTRPEEFSRQVVIKTYPDGRNYAFLVTGEDGLHILDVTNPTQLIPVGFYDTKGDARGVEIDLAQDPGQASYAYIAAGKNGIYVLDVSIPAQISKVSQFDTPGVAERIAIRNGLAYVVTGNAGLRVYDLHDFSTPKEIGKFDTPGYARSLILVDHFAYIADMQQGLLVLDITNPANPRKANSFRLQGPANDLFIKDKQAYIAIGKAGIQVLDVSDLQSIQSIGIAQTPGEAVGLTLSGGYAYVANRKAGVRIIDVTNVAQMGEVGNADTPGDAMDVAVLAKYIFVADGFDGLRVYDAFVEVSMQRKSSATRPVYAEDLDIAGNLVYLAGANRLEIVDISQREHPRRVGSFDTPGYARGIASTGDYAYMALGDAGLGVVYVHNPQRPSKITYLDTPGDANNITLVNDTIFLMDGSQGFRLYDVSNPLDPQLLASVPTVDYAFDAVADGPYAYVASGRYLRIYNISNARSPTLVGSLETGAEIRGVHKQGNFVFLANSTQGLRIVNVENPARPANVSNRDTAGFAFDVQVEGTTAYVADGADGLRLFDLSDPRNPKDISSPFIDTPGDARGVVVVDALAYVADYHRGLRIIESFDPGKATEVGAYDAPRDIRDIVLHGDFIYIVDSERGLWLMDNSKPDRLPPTLEKVGYLLVKGDAKRVAVAGELAYVAAGGDGLRIVDVSIPSAPVEVGVVDTPGDARGVVTVGKYAVVADGPGGLVGVDVSDPKQPKIVGTYATPRETNDIAISGNYAYVADGHAGLRVINLSDASNITTARTLPGLGETRSVDIAGNHAYVAAGDAGLWIIDVSSPASIKIDNQYLPGAPVIDVAVDDIYAYLALGGGGVQAVYVGYPQRPELSGSFNTSGEASIVAVAGRTDKPPFDNVYIAIRRESILVTEAEKATKPQEKDLFETPGYAPVRRVFESTLHILTALWYRNLSLVHIKVWRALQVYLFDTLLIAFVMVLWLGLVSQFTLPVSKFSEWYHAFMRVLFYLIHRHGPAILIKGGRVEQHSAADKRRGYGVVLTDLNSAAILERRGQAYPFLLQLLFGPLNKIPGLVRKIFGIKRPKVSDPLLYAIGPGMSFTKYKPVPFLPRYDYHVAAAVDLRPQVRVRPEVQGYSRDAIEVSTTIITVFTLGEPPQVVQVTYKGEQNAENLRVIHLEDKKEKGTGNGVRPVKGKLIKELRDELDLDDKVEIHRFVQSSQSGKSQPATLSKGNASQTPGPFLYDEKRVFAALYPQTQDVQEEKPMHWTELPPHMAAEIFRNRLANEAYDKLYEPLDPISYPLQNFKRDFGLAVRNLGLLAFQYVEGKERKLLEEGQDWIESELAFFPIQELKQPKILRNRGIKVIFAGFSELKPVSDAVQKQRFDNWSARWERDADLTKVDYDFEEMIIRTKARVQTQKEMAASLSKIFEAQAHSDEALALLVLQALEDAAADPATRALLPAETIQTMQTLRYWLVPGSEPPPGWMLGAPKKP